MSVHDHAWHVRQGQAAYEDEYPRWERTCSRCGDRVTAFRSTAIYQLGNDVEHLPHAIPLSTWPDYAECRAPAVTAVAEHTPIYASASPHRPGRRMRGISPIPPEQIAPQLIDRLKEARGWTDERIAEELAIDVRQLSRWRHGAQPSGFAALRLARLALFTHQPYVIRPLLRRQHATS